MITIVPIQERHLDAIAALEIACFSDPWSRRSIASELENEWSLWLIAEEGDTVAGYVGSQARSAGGGRDESCRRAGKAQEGVAQRLLARAFSGTEGARASLRGALEVRASNLAAQKLYEKNGFAQVGCERIIMLTPGGRAYPEKGAALIC